MTRPPALAAARDDLKAWLLDAAYPRWWQAGADRDHGGFHDCLDLTGRPLPGPKRARVQARQTACYGWAETLGWAGPWREAMRHGGDFLMAGHRRPDGLFHAFSGGGGDRADFVDLYDQAFALLALSVLRQAGEPNAAAAAHALLDLLPVHDGGGFAGFEGEALHSNPNMHLFEAALAWVEIGGDAIWRGVADAQARLAMERLIDPATGALGETFGPGWRAPTDPRAQTVEPGHQFEWAWLLMRWRGLGGEAAALPVALRLIDLAESAGVDPRRNVAIDRLDGDLRILDAGARLWPQTERLRAALLAARLTGQAAYWAMAERALAGLRPYLATTTPGLWADRLEPDGRFVAEPAKASSFYHIVGAIQELDRELSYVEKVETRLPDGGAHAP